VTGSTRAFGEWNPRNGVHLEWKGGSWTTRFPVSLMPRDRVEFKFVRMKPQGMDWEDGPNRVLEVPPGDVDLKLQGRFNADTVLSMASVADIAEGDRAAEAQAMAIAAHKRHIEETERQIAGLEREMYRKREQHAAEHDARLLCAEKLRAELAEVHRQIAGRRAVARAKEQEKAAAEAAAARVAREQEMARAAAARAAAEKRAMEERRIAEERRVAEQRALEEQRAAEEEQRAAERRAAEEQRAAEERREAQQRDVEARRDAEQRAVEEQRIAERRALQQRAAEARAREGQSAACEGGAVPPSAPALAQTSDVAPASDAAEQPRASPRQPGTHPAPRSPRGGPRSPTADRPESTRQPPVSHQERPDADSGAACRRPSAAIGALHVGRKSSAGIAAGLNALEVRHAAANLRSSAPASSRGAGSTAPSCPGTCPSTPGCSSGGTEDAFLAAFSALAAASHGGGGQRLGEGRRAPGRGRGPAVLQRRPQYQRSPRVPGFGVSPRAPLPEVPEAAPASQQPEAIADGAATAQAPAAWRPATAGVGSSGAALTGGAADEGQVGSGAPPAVSELSGGGTFGSGILASSPEVRAAFEVAKARFAERRAAAASGAALACTTADAAAPSPEADRPDDGLS